MRRDLATQDLRVPDQAVTEEFADDEPPRIVVRAEHIAGEWTNWARVAHAKHEFTIDFVRIDPFARRGIVVARVAGSANFVDELIRTLGVVWHDWVRNAMPPEVDEGDGGQPPEAP